jgi:hypothetical protein
MLYTHAEFWTDGGEIWHALSRPGTRELSMGILKPWEVERTLAWCRSHRMTVNDHRSGVVMSC